MEKLIVNIQNINWIDKESLEAEVLFEIRGKKFWAFCHPCNFKEKEIAQVCVRFIEEEIPDNIFWNENKQEKKEILLSENSKWRYYCYGCITSINPMIIDCGIFSIPFGDWINDKKAIGAYVYFIIARLDISRIT